MPVINVCKNTAKRNSRKLSGMVTSSKDCKINARTQTSDSNTIVKR